MPDKDLSRSPLPAEPGSPPGQAATRRGAVAWMAALPFPAVLTSMTAQPAVGPSHVSTHTASHGGGHTMLYSERRAEARPTAQHAHLDCSHSLTAPWSRSFSQPPGLLGAAAVVRDRGVICDGDHFQAPHGQPLDGRLHGTEQRRGLARIPCLLGREAGSPNSNLALLSPEGPG